MDIKKLAENIRKEVQEAISNKPSAQEAAQIRNQLLEKRVAEIFQAIPTLEADQKKLAGQLANELKNYIQDEFAKYLSTSTEQEDGDLDITLPAQMPEVGSLHPVTQVLDLVSEAFGELGFSIAEGPNIETDYYCFEQLNMPEEHPARDMQDSFYLNKELTILPRTHTSAVQIRHMQENKPPIKIIVPGRVYRNEKVTDRHFFEFYQWEGLVIDDTTTVANLKSTIEHAMRKVLDDPNLIVRFRHAYFPYTEPSFEIDFSCSECDGTGIAKDKHKSKIGGKCRLCDGKGWLEIGGLGMVHPQVLRNGGIDPDKYQGFAFGWGPGRLAMIKFGFPNFRMLWNSNLRFLKQF